MLPKDYKLLVEGFQEKKNEEERLIRMSVFHIVSPHTDKSFSFSSFCNIWPIGDEQKKDVEPILLTDEEFENLLNKRR